MATDLKSALTDLSKRLHEQGDKGQLVDDLIELIDDSPEIQLAVWQTGSSWGPEASSDNPENVIRATAPSDTEPTAYEVIGQRAGWLKCTATGGPLGSFKVTLIRRDWVAEEDRESAHAAHHLYRGRRQERGAAGP